MSLNNVTLFWREKKEIYCSTALFKLDKLTSDIETVACELCIDSTMYMTH